MIEKCLFAAVTLAGLVLSAQAQIAFTSSGTGTNSFSTFPTVSSGWSTLSVLPNAHNNITNADQLDIAVQTNSAAWVSNALGQSATVSPAPSSSGVARWNSVNLNLQTRPTGNSYTLLMATLRNDTGLDVLGMEVSYDYSALVSSDAYIQEEVPGYMTYYSLSGAPGSWVLIPEFSTNGNPASPAHLTADLEFDSAWAAGSNLYLLWADDNAAASGDNSFQGHEGCYTIDNFSANPMENLPLRVTVTPDNLATGQCSTVTFTAHVVGGNRPFAFQWYKDSFGSPISEATNSSLVLSNVQLGDAGPYLAQVTDSTPGTPQSAQSSPATLSVVVDTGVPVMLSALGDTNLQSILVTFSKPVQLTSTTGGDFTVRALDGSADLTLTNSVVINGTKVILTTAQPRELKNYTVVVQGSGIIGSCNGATIPASAFVPLTAQVLLIGMADNTAWRYRADGVDPGPDWMLPGIDLSAWSSGLAAFDGKRGSNRVYISDAGIQVPVQTPLALTNANYDNGLTDIPSYYFRTTFNFSGDPTNSSLSLVTFFDDSGVVFLNGQEVWRRRVTNDLAGQLSFDLYCPIQPSSEAAFEGPFSIPLTNINFGENLLAVCLKQVNTNSSDITMALSLVATVANFAAGPLQVAVAMVPDTGSVNQCGTASFQASAIGGSPPYLYQWYKNNTNSPVNGATSRTLVLSNVQAADAGSYFVVVTDSSASPAQVTSSALSLLVIPESGPPALLSALGETNLHTILVGFSKPVNLSSATGANFQVQALDGSDNLTIESSVVTNATNVLLRTLNARQMKNYTVLVRDAGVTGCAGAVPAGSFVPLASQFVLLGLSDSTIWNYRGDGVDPGPDWMLPGINLANWSSGLAVFDGKKGSNRVYITVTNAGVDVPIQTHLQVTNVNFQNGSVDIPTFYFRTQFQFPGEPSQSSLSLVTFFDDSGVVFLNGQEAWRLRVTNDLSGQLSFNLYCPIQPSPDADLEGPFNLPLTNIVTGDNLLAVCLKQANSISSDVTMGLSLVATVTNFPVIRPTLTVSQIDPGQVELSWPQSGIAFELQSAGGLGNPGGWMPVTEADNPSGGYHRVRVDASSGTKFFRLYLP